MDRRTVCFPLLGLLALLAGAGPAAAQAPGGKAKWEYATLTFDEPPAGDVRAAAAWEAGKQVFGGQSARFFNEALAKIYKELGGKEEHVSLGLLLDQIGQGGWEMVSHTRVLDRGRSSRTWVFKRPAP
ncbi:MAG TPA: hypothetical protein VKD90_30820 [Gemmataceae bacterium]|nr:hypothetical protein [Gemmataceae bacterium]